MKVVWVWSQDCPACTLFEETGVVDLVHATLRPVPDVWFVARQLEEVGRPVLTTDDGSVTKRQLYGTAVSEIAALYEDSVTTPGLFLVAGDTKEEHDPTAVTGADESDALTETPRLAARLILKTVFDFYLREALGLPPDMRQTLREARPTNPAVAAKHPTALEPTYEYQSFKQREWQEAFIRASEAQY